MPTTLCEAPPKDELALRTACRALQALPPEEREVFLLRQNGGLAYDRIAEAAGRTPAAVKLLMRAALRRLVAALA